MSHSHGVKSLLGHVWLLAGMCSSVLCGADSQGLGCTATVLEAAGGSENPVSCHHIIPRVNIWNGSLNPLCFLILVRRLLGNLPALGRNHLISSSMSLMFNFFPQTSVDLSFKQLFPLLDVPLLMYLCLTYL